MAYQIIYGVGKAVLRDFKDRTKVIGLATLQDLNIESSSSQDDITGGNKMFPIASFKKDMAIKVSGTNATFSGDLVEYMDGAKVSTGATAMTGFLEVSVPSTGIVTLEQTPVENSVYVVGFTKGETAGANKFSVSGKNVTFDKSVAGQVVSIVYEYTSTENTKEYSVVESSMSKPFEFSYLFPIYDEDSQIIAQGEVRIYKAQCTSGFKIDAKDKTASTQTFEASARDAQRADGKFWSLFIDGKEVV